MVGPLSPEAAVIIAERSLDAAFAQWQDVKAAADSNEHPDPLLGTALAITMRSVILAARYYRDCQTPLVDVKRAEASLAEKKTTLSKGDHNRWAAADKKWEEALSSLKEADYNVEYADFLLEGVEHDNVPALSNAAQYKVFAVRVQLQSALDAGVKDVGGIVEKLRVATRNHLASGEAVLHDLQQRGINDSQLIADWQALVDEARADLERTKTAPYYE